MRIDDGDRGMEQGRGGWIGVFLRVFAVKPMSKKSPS